MNYHLIVLFLKLKKKNYRFNEKQLILLEIKSIFEKSFCEWQFTKRTFLKRYKIEDEDEVKPGFEYVKHE